MREFGSTECGEESRESGQAELLAPAFFFEEGRSASLLCAEDNASICGEQLFYMLRRMLRSAEDIAKNGTTID